MIRPRHGRSSVPFLVLGILAGTLVAGGYLVFRAGRVEDYPLQPTRLFEQVLEHVRRHSVDSLPEGELFRRAADGLMQELDDEYASIHAAGEDVEFPADVGGLGLLLTARGGRISVLGVLPDSPAEQGGLRSGDQIAEVGEGIQDALGRDVVLAALDGDPGTEVQLRVRRPGVPQLLDFTLTRSTPIGGAVSTIIDLGEGIWYVALRLPGGEAVQGLRAELRQAVKEGARALVLDLRGAAGGGVAEAVALAGLFLPPGSPAVTVRNRAGAETAERTRSRGEFLDQELVVVVDGSTADAAEALAGALQDNDRALIVGAPSFGRGVSLEQFSVARGAVLRLSTARWITPGGRIIQRERAAAPDSLQERPVFRTSAGREVRGGGGIVPDSLVSRNRRGEAELALLRAVGAGLPAYDSIIRATASELAETGRVGSERFQPSGADLSLVRRRADARGVGPGDDARQAEEAYVARELGDWAVLRALGRAGLVRRAAQREPALRLAIGVTRSAGSPAELLGLADSAASAR